MQATTSSPTMPFAALGYEVAHVRVQPVERRRDRVAGRPRRTSQVGFDGQPTWSDSRRRGRAEARALGATVRRRAGVEPLRAQRPRRRRPALRLQAGLACRAARHGSTAGSPHDPDAQIALVGDWNIAPTDEDVWSIGVLRDSTHVTGRSAPPSSAIVDAGSPTWCGLSRRDPPSTPTGTTPQLRFPKNRGMRIDFILGSPALADASPTPRSSARSAKGKAPSDHAPVLVELG